MFECYSFPVNYRGNQSRPLRLRETTTQFSQDGNTYSFPDGFTLLDQEKEVGRLALEEVEICVEHENCFISLPSMFSLELCSSNLRVLLDEEKFALAMRSSPAEILEAYRVIPILVHRLSQSSDQQLGSVATAAEAAEAGDDALLTTEQKQLCQAMQALGSEIEIPESTVIRIGNTSFYADLAQHCIVERPNDKLCKLECHGGLIVSSPGFGRKRAVLAHAKAAAQPQATEQEQEMLLCHFPIGVICSPSELSLWFKEASLLFQDVLVIPDVQTLSLLTTQRFQQFEIVLISSKVFESSLFWARAPDLRDDRFRRCDLIMHLRRLGRLAQSSPLLDLVYWKSLIFAEPIKPSLTKNFQAGQRWVLMPGSNLVQVHRAWELIQPECSADFPLPSFAKHFGLDWRPTSRLPKLNKESILIEMTSVAKAYLLEDSWNSDTVCGPIKRRRHLFKRDKICAAILANNLAHLKKLETYTKKLRAQEKLWHRELEREDEPSEWDASFLGDFSAVREQILQTELDLVEANLRLVHKTHQLFSRVEQHHLETALGEQCPVCGDENEAIFRCGHGTCWSCVWTLFKEKKQIKCPQCRSSLVRGDIWLVDTERGETKFNVLERLLEKTEKPCLIVLQTNAGCKALQRALPQFAIQPITDQLEDRIYVGKQARLSNQHLALKHLIVLHPIECDPIIQHIGNPHQQCQTTRLLYKEFETV